jgi:anti-anti-sigma regulatory factor
VSSLHGEVDPANDALLAAMLSVAANRADQSLIVKCDGLTFMSVSAWRSAVTNRHGGGS